MRLRQSARARERGTRVGIFVEREPLNGGIKMTLIRLFSTVSIVVISVSSSIGLAQDLSATRPRRVTPVTLEVSDQDATKLAISPEVDSPEFDLAVASSWVRLTKHNPPGHSRSFTSTAANNNQTITVDKVSVGDTRITGKAEKGATVEFFRKDVNKPEKTVTANPQQGAFIVVLDKQIAKDDQIWV